MFVTKAVALEFGIGWESGRGEFFVEAVGVVFVERKIVRRGAFVLSLHAVGRSVFRGAL